MQSGIGRNLKKLWRVCAARQEAILTIFGFLVAYGFIFAILDVGLVFTNTHVAGGDTGSHIYIPYYLKQIFPRLKWWSPDWYSGFPFLYFYPPLMYAATVLLGFVIPLNIAFKLIIFSGILIFPLSFYLSLKWLGAKYPAPPLGIVLSLFLIFLEKYTIYGGNAASLLAGQFSHTFSIALLFMFIGLMYKGMKEGKYLVWNIILGSAVILTHPISGLLMIAIAIIFPFQTGKYKKNFIYTALTYLGIFLLSAFWTLGLVWYKGYSGSMQWVAQIKLDELFPFHWLPLIVAAFLGVILAIYKKERSLLAFFGLLILTSAVYLYLNNSIVWNTRFLPYISYSIIFLAAYFGGNVLAYVKKKSHLAVAVIFLIISGFSIYLVNANITFVPAWFKWNFEGYEAKAPWPEAENLFNYLKTLPNGRVMWEYRPEYDKYGTPRVLETIPVFAGQPTFEGLLIESGLTGPFHFVNQAETTDKPTSAIAGFQYPPFDFGKGIKHLQMSGASYFVAYSDLIKGYANNNRNLVKMSDIGPFSVYKVTGSDMVDSVQDFTVQQKDKNWLNESFEWYKKADPSRPIVFAQNESEKQSLANMKPEGSRFEAARITNLKQTNDSIEFDTDKIGTPVVVKISYFPTWKAEGAKGPYLVSSAYMMVIPTSHHVKLHFTYGWIDWTGIALSFAGIGYLVFVGKIYGKNK